MLILHLQSVEGLEDEWPEVLAETVQQRVFPSARTSQGRFYDVEYRGGEGDDKFVKARMWRIRASPILAKTWVLGQQVFFWAKN